jgi:hypothetical protein
MNGSAQHHQPVLEALCAFVRVGIVGIIADEKGPATDIQAALTVIGRREPGKGDVDLTATRIPNASLSGANLSGTNLRSAQLNRAQLNSAFLSGADLGAAGYLTQAQLDVACGTNAKPPPSLTLKPCVISN